MEELNSKLAELENEMRSIYNEITGREDEEIHGRFAEDVKPTIFAEIHNTRADIAEDLIADVRKLESLLAEASENSRQKESINTRENLQHLQTDEMTDLKSRSDWYLTTNHPEEGVYKDGDIERLIDELCDSLANRLGNWNLEESRAVVLKTKEQLLESREQNNGEIKGRIGQKIQDIVQQIEEVEKGKEVEGIEDNKKMGGLFADLSGSVKSAEEVSDFYREDKPAKEVQALDPNCIE